MYRAPIICEDDVISIQDSALIALLQTFVTNYLKSISELHMLTECAARTLG